MGKKLKNGLDRYIGGFPKAARPFLMVGLLVLIAHSPRAAFSADVAAGGVSALQVKAAYIYNFSLFVEWPEKSFSTQNSPYTVCVLGDDRFSEALVHTLKGRGSKGRLFEVKASKWPQDLAGCHIAYVGPASSKEPGESIKYFSGQRALVVGDFAGAGDMGAIINFFTEGDRVRFEVNLAAARKAGYSISSRMLQLARIIGGDATP